MAEFAVWRKVPPSAGVAKCRAPPTGLVPKIPGAVVCCSIVNRLKGDQITSTKEFLKAIERYPLAMILQVILKEIKIKFFKLNFRQSKIDVHENDGEDLSSKFRYLITFSKLCHPRFSQLQ